MDCLIIAAGMGSRLSKIGASKPLVPVRGVPLIERVIITALQAGIRNFTIVTGHRAEPLETYLKSSAVRFSANLTFCHNPRFEAPNALSVLAARGHIRPPFLLTMCDHLFDPGIISDLARQRLADGEVVLAVDGRLGNPMVDMDDVTRVLEKDGLIRNIGKGIRAYNAFDTGLFLASEGLFEAIEEARSVGSEVNISAAMMRLVARDKARTFDIGERFWIDVDDPAALKKAESHLLGMPVRAPGPASRG
jgi:1L-myo-inositol 1-phosphate cytidylyltransferase